MEQKIVIIHLFVGIIVDIFIIIYQTSWSIIELFTLFHRLMVIFHFVSFTKIKNKKFRHHLQNLFNTINHKSSFKSQFQATPSSFLWEPSNRKIENNANTIIDKRHVRFTRWKHAKITIMIHGFLIEKSYLSRAMH